MKVNARPERLKFIFLLNAFIAENIIA